MRALILAAPVLLLVGCGQGGDAYRFERKEFERSQPAITIITHPSLADLRAKAPASAKADTSRQAHAEPFVDHRMGEGRFGMVRLEDMGGGPGACRFVQLALVEY